MDRGYGRELPLEGRDAKPKGKWYRGVRGVGEVRVSRETWKVGEGWEVGEVEGEQSGRGGGRKAATPGSAPSTARRGEGGGVLVGGLPNATW